MSVTKNYLNKNKTKFNWRVFVYIPTGEYDRFGKGSISEKFNTPMLYGNKLDLIPTHKFAHRITIHFSLYEHIYLQTIVYELKQKGLDWVNFSVVVRSILYEALGLVTEYRISHRSTKQLLSVA